MYKVILILDEFFLKYEDGVKLTPPPIKKLPAKSLALLGLNWLDKEPRVQERQQVKDQQSYISIFIAYLTIPSDSLEHQHRHANCIPCMAISKICRDTEQFQEKIYINIPCQNK